MELETLKVCIDGADCSGKTTLWNSIHKQTGYRWKLEDRSFLTMVVYARLHGRKKLEDYRRQLRQDLNVLNHKYVLINLPWEVIESRYMSRGDDLHDLQALKKIHALYDEEIRAVSSLPNVLVLNEVGNSTEDAKRVDEWLRSQDTIDLNGLTKLIQDHASSSPGGEVSPMRFSFVEDGTYPENQDLILDHRWVHEHFPKVKIATVLEFNKMANEFLQTISKELQGENIYNKPQDLTSRRFIFNQEACVSFVQVMYRDNMLKFYVTCRSSHVVDVFPADLRLLYHMCKRAHEKLNVSSDTRVLFDFSLNSAHVVA